MTIPVPVPSSAANNLYKVLHIIMSTDWDTQAKCFDAIRWLWCISLTPVFLLDALDQILMMGKDQQFQLSTSGLGKKPLEMDGKHDEKYNNRDWCVETRLLDFLRSSSRRVIHR